MVVDGYTLIIKSRKVLDDERIQEALAAAMEKLGQKKPAIHNHDNDFENRQAA